MLQSVAGTPGYILSPEALILGSRDAPFDINMRQVGLRAVYLLHSRSWSAPSRQSMSCRRRRAQQSPVQHSTCERLPCCVPGPPRSCRWSLCGQAVDRNIEAEATRRAAGLAGHQMTKGASQRCAAALLL
jgi:hypothetical protein